MQSNSSTNPVDQAIMSRHSIRSYQNKPVSQAQIEQLLSVARYAPSGTNTQPWKVHALTGEPLAGFCKAVTAAFMEPDAATKYQEEYPYYPVKWQSPYIDRRRKVGWDLYGLLGIGKADREKMQSQHARNFSFFGAPVGLIFTIDRVMQQGSWMDYGMFLQSIMVAARGMGLDTCPQAAFTQFHAVIREQLQYPDTDMLVCGMALGYANLDAIENTLRTDREPVTGFATLHGF